MHTGSPKEQNPVPRWQSSWNNNMKDTLTHIVKAIVQNPDDVLISETEADGVVALTITVNPSDMGRIIGKSGKVIRSIRNVMKIPAIKQNKRIDISLCEQ